MDKTPDGGPDPDPELPPHLRQLRVLVTVLTVVMIAGVITISALLVIRLSAADATPPILVTPDAFEMPTGVGLTGYAVVGDNAVLIGDDGVIRVFNLETGALLRDIVLD